MAIKVKQVQYAEKVKICYEVESDKYVVESAETPNQHFRDAFHDLKKIAAKVGGITAAITRLDVFYLPEDDDQIKAVSLSAEMAFIPPFTGETVIKMPMIAAGELKESDLLIIDAVIINAVEYLKGNRAQLKLVFNE